MEIEKKIEAMGLSLPRIGSPIGHLVRTVRVGNLVFVSGFIGRGPNGVIQGTLGLDLKVEQGYEAARFAALNLLSLLKDEIGDLDKVKRIVKLLSFVKSTADSRDLPKVTDGASDLLVELYGENGKHARSTVGVVNVGGGSCVEIEMIVELKPEL